MESRSALGGSGKRCLSGSRAGVSAWVERSESGSMGSSLAARFGGGEDGDHDLELLDGDVSGTPRVRAAASALAARRVTARAARPVLDWPKQECAARHARGPHTRIRTRARPTAHTEKLGHEGAHASDRAHAHFRH
eukprot:1624596-Pleurochrysis_carterae.AAC.1